MHRRPVTVPDGVLPSGRLPAEVVGHTSPAHVDEAAVLAVAAILVGVTVRDVLDGDDVAPTVTRQRGWRGVREWLTPNRLAGLAPVAATLAVSVLVWTRPMGIWLWGVAVIYGGTVALRPFVHGRRLAVREPTADERAQFAAAGVGHRTVRVVETGRPDALNGYTIGGPLSETVGVSRAAVRRLAPAHLAAAVAHERGHHAGRHALVRAGASVAWLVAGAFCITTAFAQTTTVASAAILVWVVGERLVATAVGRVTEYRADAFAARRTSPAAVAGLLSTLGSADSGGTGERLVGALSTHPPDDRRIARLDGTGTNVERLIPESGG